MVTELETKLRPLFMLTSREADLKREEGHGANDKSAWVPETGSNWHIGKTSVQSRLHSRSNFMESWSRAKEIGIHDNQGLFH